MQLSATTQRAKAIAWLGCMGDIHHCFVSEYAYYVTKRLVMEDLCISEVGKALLSCLDVVLLAKRDISALPRISPSVHGL